MIEMKNSGVDWIGEIPAHWEVKRLKDISYLYGGLTGKAGEDFTPEQEKGTKPYIPFTNVLNNYVINPQKMNYVYISEGEVQNRVKRNDLIFLMSSEDYESIAKSAVVLDELGEVYLNSFCRGLRFTDKRIEPKFVNYLLSATPCRDALRFEARGFTRINIKIEKIASQFIFYPPLAEQQAIADYLDEKTAEIDAQVALLEKKRESYNKLKRSLISNVVSRGLTPTVTLKDSGNDWIGEIPVHWQIKRIKDVAELGSGTTPKSTNEKYYDDGIHPWLITGDVQNRLIKSNDNFITDLALAEIPNLKLYPSKTVLLAMYGGGTIGNVGLMTYPAYINQACCAMIPKPIVFEKYLFYYLQTKQDRIISTGVGGTQINLSQNKISAYPIIIPPLEEQQAIADYLDKKTAEIDEQIDLIDKKIDTYKKLNQSLIDEVVTGKRKIYYRV